MVSESYFGNTLTVARAIAAGHVQVRGQDPVTVVGASEAQIGSDVDLLLVGAPTHDFSMPKEQMRMQAAEKGATNADQPAIVLSLSDRYLVMSSQVCAIWHCFGSGLR